MVPPPHTMPAPFIAPEYLNPSTVPELRPNSPFRLGPTLFLPATRSWQALHLLNTFLPASASPAPAGPPAQAEAAAPMPLTLAGAADPAQLGAFLMVLRYRGETAAELAGFVRAARERIAPQAAAAGDLDRPAYADRHKQLP